MKENSMERLYKFREKLAAAGVDGMIISGGENRRYLSGFTGSAGVLAIDARAACLVTDFRYWEQATAEATGFTIYKQGSDLPQSVVGLIRDLQWRSVGFEPENLTYRQYQQVREVLPQTVQFIPVPDLVGTLRAVKDDTEIALLAEAERITEKAWEKTLTVIKPGVSESDVAMEFDYQLRVNGAEGNAFSTIVAFGARSALPHAAPTTKKIQPGELILIDGGAKYQGYHGDLTRTVVLGKATARQLEIYQIVLTAQKKALAGIKAGLTGKALDALARQEILAQGYGEYFGHGLGHSVGLEIHENPRLSSRESTPIPAGATVTVEPGIYLPEWGGVRIEDLVVVETEGIRNLSASPKEQLIQL
jgi:Xaa-Pro aminopeptidase